MEVTGLAIAATSCVMKLVAFSFDFVADTKQVYKKGATDRNIDLKTVANSIQGAAKQLKSQLGQFIMHDQDGSIEKVETLYFTMMMMMMRLFTSRWLYFTRCSDKTFFREEELEEFFTGSRGVIDLLGNRPWWY
ncbi:hypothetical protein F4804DRAFT_314692 [Jackrogersella minutella]|nr:hypothetical protein F4804DRAFT_314692 [Jackrogersella minutella]